MFPVTKIAVVVVNYKTPRLVVDCLMSLKEAATCFDLSVFIGDADSGDGSVESINAFIAQENMTWAHCFAIGQNGGFAYGNNTILARCVLPDPDVSLVYFLNPDTYVRPGAVAALVSFLQAHPDAGIAGSQLENPDGSLQSCAFRTPSPAREFFRGIRLAVFDHLFPKTNVTISDMQGAQQVDWVTGASFMMRRDALDDIGLMDDGYFLYFEETDLMIRARAAGYAVWHVGDSRVVHLEGQSTGVRNIEDSRHVRPPSVHFLASRKKFMRKHFGPLGPAFANICFLTGDLFYRLHRLLRAKPIENPPRLWLSYLNARRE